MANQVETVQQLPSANSRGNAAVDGEVCAFGGLIFLHCLAHQQNSEAGPRQWGARGGRGSTPCSRVKRDSGYRGGRGHKLRRGRGSTVTGKSNTIGGNNGHNKEQQHCWRKQGSSTTGGTDPLRQQQRG